MSLSNSQINAILKEYDEKNFRNRAELDRRRAKIYRELPEYRKLDDMLLNSISEYTKKALFDEDSYNLSEMKACNNQLISQKKHILTSAGYPDDYLEMVYDCPKCQDTGYIDNKPCACFRQSTIKLLYSQALTNTAIATQNFNTFDYSLYDSTHVDEMLGLTPYDNIKRIVATCNKFIEELDKEPLERTIKNLLIMGNAGVGKTFLTNCIAKAALDNAHSVVYITAGEFFSILEATSFNKDFDDDDPSAALENIEQCDLLIIDDLGTEFTNRFTNAKLYECINNRLLKNLPMIISTNLNFKDLRQAYSERVGSRFIGEFTSFKIIGDDIRIKKN